MGQNSSQLQHPGSQPNPSPDASSTHSTGSSHSPSASPPPSAHDSHIPETPAPQTTANPSALDDDPGDGAMDPKPPKSRKRGSGKSKTKKRDSESAPEQADTPSSIVERASKKRKHDDPEQPSGKKQKKKRVTSGDDEGAGGDDSIVTQPEAQPEDEGQDPPGGETAESPAHQLKKGKKDKKRKRKSKSGTQSDDVQPDDAQEPSFSVLAQTTYPRQPTHEDVNPSREASPAPDPAKDLSPPRDPRDIKAGTPPDDEDDYGMDIDRPPRPATLQEEQEVFNHGPALVAHAISGDGFNNTEANETQDSEHVENVAVPSSAGYSLDLSAILPNGGDPSNIANEPDALIASSLPLPGPNGNADQQSSAVEPAALDDAGEATSRPSTTRKRFAKPSFYTRASELATDSPAPTSSPSAAAAASRQKRAKQPPPEKATPTAAPSSSGPAEARAGKDSASTAATPKATKTAKKTQLAEGSSDDPSGNSDDEVSAAYALPESSESAETNTKPSKDSSKTSATPRSTRSSKKSIEEIAKRTATPASSKKTLKIPKISSLASQANTPIKSSPSSQTPRSQRGNVFSDFEMRGIDDAILRWREMYDITAEQMNETIHANPQKVDSGPFWTHVCAVCPNLPRQKVINSVRRRYHNFVARGTWTQAQHDELSQLYELHGNKPTLIAKEINRYPEDVRDRIRNYVVCGDNRRDQTWDPEEVAKFARIVNEALKSIRELRISNPNKAHPPDESLIDWGVVSEKLKYSRSQLQCRTKWKQLSGALARQKDMPTETMVADAQAEADSMTMDDRYKLVEAIFNSGAQHVNRIPLGKLVKEVMGSDFTRPGLFVAYHRLRQMVPHWHMMPVKDIAEKLCEVYEQTGELEYPDESTYDAEEEQEVIVHRFVETNASGNGKKAKSSSWIAVDEDDSDNDVGENGVATQNGASAEEPDNAARGEDAADSSDSDEEEAANGETPVQDDINGNNEGNGDKASAQDDVEESESPVQDSADNDAPMEDVPMEDVSAGDRSSAELGVDLAAHPRQTRDEIEDSEPETRSTSKTKTTPKSRSAEKSSRLNGKGLSPEKFKRVSQQESRGSNERGSARSKNKTTYSRKSKPKPKPSKQQDNEATEASSDTNASEVESIPAY